MSRWWHDAAIYQIYPRSFADANGDGCGDLAGIIGHLDYVRDLGVGAVWLSPIFQSPMADFGYDISDYRAIDTIFGDMAAFDRLLEECHDRGLKLLLDFVPNHTSDQHQWFIESRSSRDNPKRNWYIWHDPAPGEGLPERRLPNNWQSNFGGSAWQWDEATGQFYYHAFLAAQPDLNWRNARVRAAMTEVLRFWLDKGVDGFRVDVIWHLIKDAEFRDNPPNPGWRPGMPDIDRYLPVYSADQPLVHDVIAELRQVIDAYPDRLLIGEIYLPIDRLMDYYGRSNDGVHLPFNFQLIHAHWDAESLGRLIHEYEGSLPEGGWPNWVLSNHDQPRIAERLGEAQARVAAMLLLTLRGTPTLYYGDELGIADISVPVGAERDPAAVNEPGVSFNRDRARSPMQWSDAAHAGFSQQTPWLPLTEDWRTRNVAVQSGDAGSMLELHRALLSLRNARDDLRDGAYEPFDAGAGILAYRRGENIVVVLNPSHASCALRLPGKARVLLSAKTGLSGDAPPGVLAGDDGLVLEITGAWLAEGGE